MDTNEHELKEDKVVRAVIGAAYEVANVLGPGFLEKIYQRAMFHELALRGFRASSQTAFPVIYKGECLGQYMADLVVEAQVIVELKCVDTFLNEHIAQCLNYLRASRLKLALLINFQRPRVEWKRLIL